MNVFIKALFVFFIICKNAYSFDLNKNNIISIIQNIDLELVEAQIELLDELYLLNTIVFRSASVNNLYKEHADSIVYIQTDVGLGSGVIINNDGDIITNAHVISDSKNIFVVFKPIKGTNVPISAIHEAEIIKIDRRRDLALIRALYPPNNINPIRIGEISDGDDLIGLTANCIGHPDGLTWTYTKGIVSSYRKDYDWPYYTDKFLKSKNELTKEEIDIELEKSKMHRANLIQTDCSINPGNSGGALISDKGELLGINTFKSSKNELINFAVAANEINDFIRSDKFVELQSVKDFSNKKNQPQFISGEDTTGDGKQDKKYFDFDGNGVVDTLAIDENADDLADIFILDVNENGKIDAQINYLADNSKEHYFDIDEDGKFDAVFIDKDNDGDYEIKKKL